MADNAPTLANVLAGPVMPEEYDRFENPVLPHARAFGAGFVDPAGIPSWLLNVLARNAPSYSPVTSETADWYQRRMQEARDESPMAAGIGSTLLPGWWWGARGGMNAKELLQATPLLIAGGGAAGNLREGLSPPPRQQRPQARYPTGGW